MQASDVMSSPVHVVSPYEPVSHARSLMLKHKISRVPVMDEGRLVGILTKKDIAYRLRQSEPIWRRRPIDRIPVQILMVPDPITIDSDTSIPEIARLMLTHDISGLPVLEDGAVAGIVTKSDVLRSEAVRRLNVSVGDLMTDVTTLNRYHSLDHIIDLMSERHDKMVVVNDNGSIAGIITESNVAFFVFTQNDPDSVETGVPEKEVKLLRKAVPAGRKQLRDVMEVSSVAEDVMSRPVITVKVTASISEAIAEMQKHHITSVVAVGENDELRGIVKRDDIIREVAK